MAGSKRYVLLGAIALVGAFLTGVAPAAAEANGVALTPQMGWSSWSFIRSNPTEANIEAQAKAMHDTGLTAHGYTYVNIDDFYYLDPATTVDAYGRWVTDTGKFPDGMAAVAGYVHGLGEKFGMYLTPGIPVAAYQQNTPIQGTSYHARDIVSDTSRYEANYNYGNGAMYFIDYAKNPTAAQAFLNSWADELASWGVDYVKLDGVGDGDIGDVQHWSQALDQTGRPIHFELSNSLDVHNGALWRQYANGWRIDGDVECYCSSGSYPLTNWNNVSARFTDEPGWTQFAGPGGWNDPDSVEVGNGSNDGLTPDERQTQLTLWAISAA
ncbi:MAG TPA: glycoside hydrolase family 27 protein, partial [Pseudonocardiaceae bacterium]|nr:glycoside hydrolase family 27 protein [Pseudonocardiaceae bacterium]